MNLYNKGRKTKTGDPTYPLWVSDKKKRANNNALAKDYMDYFDQANELNVERVSKIQENFDIHAGRWPTIESLNSGIEIALGGENVTLGSGKLHHYPIIDRVSKSVVSDLIMRPLIPVIKDSSAKGRSHRERVRLEKVKTFFQKTVIEPGIQIATMEFDQANGVMDPQTLPEEVQKQREFEIQNRFKQETPEEIFSYMERLTTPDEMVAEALVSEGMKHTRAKSKFATGAENAVVAAEEYYRVNLINGLPEIEVLNPKWVVWGGSEHTEFCEDSQFAKYVQYLTPEDAITKYSSFLMGKDIKKLSNLYSQIPGYTKDNDRKRSKSGIDRTLVDLFADNPELNNDINLRTKEGQDKFKDLHRHLTHGFKEGYGIRECYITWRWIRKVNFVERVVDGVVKVLVRDEHYKMDPLAGDLSVTPKAIPQVWHGVKLGEEFYINVEPLPWQYTNINNPWDVKLGIFGGKYNTYQNNTENSSLVDLGKPWQYKYNLLMKRMEEHQATDIGRVFLGTTSMLPKGWTWAQWYKSLFLARTAIVSNHREGTNSLDASIFRSVDLSRTNDIQSDIAQLEYFENKVITSMYYSPQKIGDISQYATNSNTQASLAGVDRQMYRFHNRNREIKERVLNTFMHLCIYGYKDNDEVKNTILDDFLKAHYELNFNSVEHSNFSLSVVDDFRESEKLEQMRQLALTFLQNGMTPGQLSAIMNAESMAQLQQYLEDIDRKVRENQQAEFNREEALIEKQRQSAEAQLQLQQQFISAENQRMDDVKIRLAEINSLQMENAQDVNRNKVNDSLERAILEIESKEKMKKMELEHDSKVQNKKFDLESKKINKMNSQK